MKKEKTLKEKVQSLPFNYIAVARDDLTKMNEACSRFDFPFEVKINWDANGITVCYPIGENPDKMKPYEQSLKDYILEFSQKKIDQRHAAAEE